MDRNLSSSKHTRNQMKALSELASLLPHQPPKGVASVSDQVLEESVDYIKKLQEKLEKLKHKKKCLMRVMSENSTTPDLKTPNISISVTGMALYVVMTTGLDYQFMFARVVRMLQEEGAHVVNASFSVVDDTIFHTIHSQVNGENGAEAEREAGRICERLRKFVSDVD